MPRHVRTKRVGAAQARSYLAKAEEFLEAARESLGSGRTIAATSLAVHAGINATDAITAARVGQRAAGPDHDLDVRSSGNAEFADATMSRGRTRLPQVEPSHQLEGVLRSADHVARGED